jgi:hypothetical protein
MQCKGNGTLGRLLLAYLECFMKRVKTTFVPRRPRSRVSTVVLPGSVYKRCCYRMGVRCLLASLFFIRHRSVGKGGNTSTVVGHCIL